MSILDFLFPKKCLSCGQKGRYFCSDCLLKIKKTKQICPVCERNSPFGQTHPICLSNLSLSGFISFFVYEGIIRTSIHRLKYQFVTDLFEEFWEIVRQNLEERKEEFFALDQFLRKKPIIVPIPLFWYKENFRGFNQSFLFAQKIAQHFQLSCSSSLLIRRKPTVTQTQLDFKERKKNVADAFVVNSKFWIPEANILLIDDVWTTGATLKSATKVLKYKGAGEIWGLTLAR